MTAYEQATATTGTTTDRSATDSVKDQAGAVAGTAKSEAGNVAGAATHAASDVAGTAKEQVANVATEAKSQIGTLATQAKAQVSEQATAQTQKAAATTRNFADQLQALARGERTEGVATDIVRDISDRVQMIATKLESTEPQELLDEVRRYARNKPGMFLIGAVAAGFIGGRLVKGATADSDSDSDQKYSGSNGSKGVWAGSTDSTYTPRYGGTAGGATTSGREAPTTGTGHAAGHGADTYPDEPRPGSFGGSI
ncbi:MAG: hypothetical protein ABIM89_18140 [Mycobacteriales bacterium]